MNESVFQQVYDNFKKVVDAKIADWVKTKPRLELVSTFSDDHIECANFTINSKPFVAYWIGSEGVGAFKYAASSAEAFESAVQLIHDKIMSGPHEPDSYEYAIAIEVGFTHEELEQLGMLDE